MSEDVFLSKLAEILAVNRKDMGQFKLDFNNWDSLMVIETIAAIDQHFGVTVPTKKLTACKSVEELLRLIRNNLEPS
jgi:acyl carrier protein